MKKMKKLANKDQLAAAPKWLKAFIDDGWAKPDADGQRQCWPRVDRRIASTAAQHISDAFSTSAVDQALSFNLDNSGGTFGMVSFWDDPMLELAFNLATIWTDRRNVAQCLHCGALHLPGKGRIARFCSDACRVYSHRGAA